MKEPITKVSFRMATPDDAQLPAYDNTKLVAYSTCPTWGVVTHGMNKVMSQGGRNLALEAGTVMHEVFAWVRLCTLLKQPPHGQTLFTYHGKRLFGEDRFVTITDEAWQDDEVGDVPRLDQLARRGAIAVLESSVYYDDPRDRRRTLSNMEECALAYIDRWDWKNKIWVRDENDPYSDVGIEIPFDIVVEVDTKSLSGLLVPYTCARQWRFTGKIDGISTHHTTGLLTVEDNKTASRLGDAWAAQWPMSSQVTGYCIAASIFTGADIRRATIHGLCIPLPKTYDYGGVIQEHVEREDYHIDTWIQWFVQTIHGYERDKDNPFDALRYTHSCSRYFHPCSLLPFCDAPREEQEEILTEMVHHEWSPLNG